MEDTDHFRIIMLVIVLVTFYAGIILIYGGIILTEHRLQKEDEEILKASKAKAKAI